MVYKSFSEKNTYDFENLMFSQEWIRRLLSFGMWRRLVCLIGRLQLFWWTRLPISSR